MANCRFFFFLVITAVDVFQSTLLTPGRLKPATLCAWVSVSDFFQSELNISVSQRAQREVDKLKIINLLRGR